MKAFLFAIAVLLIPVSADAMCVCSCQKGKMHTLCLDQTVVSKCVGICAGDVCMGPCGLDPSVAEQSRIEFEAAQHRDKLIPPSAGTVRP